MSSDVGRGREKAVELPSQRRPSKRARVRLPRIVGAVNLTEDSFSDGGRYLDPEVAIAHALVLVRDGAEVIELGPASTRPDARSVSPEQERRRLRPVLERLEREGIEVAVDSFLPETQTWCAARGVAYLNDIQGFPHEEIYPELAAARCTLVVMHSVQRRGPATRVATDPERVIQGLYEFFEERLAGLEAAGIARGRIVIDPGMGLFLGSNPEPSIRALREIPALRERFGLPVLVSVSRKSFLGSMTGRPVRERGAATLAAELYAAQQGADYIRTHDVAALRDVLSVLARLAEDTPG